MNEQETFTEQLLDTEWVELMKTARDLGLSVEEVKEFLAVHKVSILA